MSKWKFSFPNPFSKKERIKWSGIDNEGRGWIIFLILLFGSMFLYDYFIGNIW